MGRTAIVWSSFMCIIHVVTLCIIGLKLKKKSTKTNCTKSYFAYDQCIIAVIGVIIIDDAQCDHKVVCSLPNIEKACSKKICYMYGALPTGVCICRMRYGTCVIYISLVRIKNQWRSRFLIKFVPGLYLVFLKCWIKIFI